jgi:uncharacterized protein
VKLSRRTLYFQILILIIAIGSSIEIVAHLGAEILWFQEVGYLPTYLAQLRAKGILGALVFVVAIVYLLGNLALAQRLSSPAGLKPELPQVSALKLRWLLPLTLSLSLLVGLISLHYLGAIAIDGRLADNAPSIAPPAPVLFQPLAIWQLFKQSVTHRWETLGAIGLAIAIQFYPRQVLKSIAIVLTLAISLVVAQQWMRVLPYFHPTAFHLEDPVFGQDIAAYIFNLPVAELLEFALTGICLYGFIAVALIYLLAGDSLSQGRFLGCSRSQQRHLYGLAGAVMLVVGLSYWLDCYELLYSTLGVSDGASYTDINVRLPADRVLSGLSIAIAIYLFYRSIHYTRSASYHVYTSLEIGEIGVNPPKSPLTRGTKIRILAPLLRGFGGFRSRNEVNPTPVPVSSKPIFTIFWLYAVAIGISLILPPLIQVLVVQPNELARETPYLQRTIALTRQAFGLDKIEIDTFDPQATLTEADLQANSSTIENIRLWDKQPLLDTNRQLQQIRLYYRFPDADIDRYPLTTAEPTEQQQVLIAARELDYTAVPKQAQTWVNQHLIYTHGYGFTMSPVNRVAPGGLPEYLVKDIGMKASQAVPNNIPIGQPRIYYGEIANTYIMTNTQVKELDYPSGNENVYNIYDGRGGIRIDSLWRKVLFATYLNDWRLILTPEFLPETKLLFRRNIDRRIRSIAPFLRFDRDPYLVSTSVNDTNSLYWIVDAYTTSDRYPYSDVGTEGINYIRNSVKVVVDAYHGSVKFYLTDPDDPIVNTWAKVFPDLFQPLSAMPVNLRRHLRYPSDFFKLQSERLMTYHMTDPQVFYNREDQWQVPTEVYGDKPRLVEPYYLITKLPTLAEEEFILFLPYTPQQRTNSIAWLAARSDGDNYGKLSLYTFPKQRLIYGPEQIEARINQDPVISQQISLWNRQGSRVIQGNLLIVPIEQSLLYVEPIYLEATQNQLPTLVRVIVAYENRIVMAQNLQQALTAIFQATTPTSPAIVRPVSPVRP